MDRDRAINVRCTADEVEMLKALAEHRGLSQSDVVRQLIRSAFATEVLAARGTQKKSKRR